MKGGSLFLPLVITKAGSTPPSLHFAKKSKIAKVAPVFYKVVQDNDVRQRFGMRQASLRLVSACLSKWR